MAFRHKLDVFLRFMGALFLVLIAIVILAGLGTASRASENAAATVRPTIAPNTFSWSTPTPPALTPTDAQRQARAATEANVSATQTAAAAKRKPTPTPYRAAIPQPQRTATPEPRSVAQGNANYPHLLSQNAEFTGEALGKLGELMLSPQLTSAYWNDEVELQASIIQGKYLEATLYTPPPQYIELHRQYLSAMELYDAAMDDLLEGIDNVDATALDRALQKMTSGEERMNEAGRTLDTLLR